METHAALSSTVWRVGDGQFPDFPNSTTVAAIRRRRSCSVSSIPRYHPYLPFVRVRVRVRFRVRVRVKIDFGKDKPPLSGPSAKTLAMRRWHSEQKCFGCTSPWSLPTSMPTLGSVLANILRHNTETCAKNQRIDHVRHDTLWTTALCGCPRLVCHCRTYETCEIVSFWVQSNIVTCGQTPQKMCFSRWRKVATARKDSYLTQKAATEL